MQKLPRSFYGRDTIAVARELLGKWLVHAARGEERVGKIVEAEAYLGPHDLAAHSSKGEDRAGSRFPALKQVQASPIQGIMLLVFSIAL